MKAPPPRRRDSPPAIPDELFEEFLLRLPPDDPACLLRASLVCKAWSHTVSSPRFRRRLHELHGTPPVLGFLHNWEDDLIPRFISTTASSFPLAAPDRRTWRWRALDCRHGRALFLPQEPISGFAGLELLLWEPITGAQQHIPLPAEFQSDYPTAAVFCAADGCDHRDCLGGPFRVVVFLFSVLADDEETYVTSASVYSSETGAWGELTSVPCTTSMEFTERYNLLVDRSVLYFMSNCDSSTEAVAEYDLASHNLTVLGLPDMYYKRAYSLVLVEDGRIGLIQYLDTRLKLWRREPSAEAGWVLNRVMCLENFLPMDALLHAQDRMQVLGFAEEANVIFVNTVVGLFTIELRSGHARKVCSDRGSCSLIPVVSFYTPVPRADHQNLPASKPSAEAGGEEGGDQEEKTVDLAQQLLNKGSNATKEVDFINTFEYVSHNLETRVPCYGEGALEGDGMLNKPGCALLTKDSSGDVPKSAPNLCLCFHPGFPGVCECTTRRDDARNSTTSESNVDDAPRLEKDCCLQVNMASFACSSEQQQVEEETKR